MIYFLKFPDEQSCIEQLTEAGFIAEDGSVILSSHSHTLDIVGQIVRGGEYDVDGNVITPPVVLDGWHVNFIGELPEELICFMVWPKNPVRLFYI